MKKNNNCGTMRLLVALLFTLLNSLTMSAQRFGKHLVFISDDEHASEIVSIKSDNPFSVKTNNRFSWVKYEVLGESVRINVSANNTESTRNDSLFLLDETGIAVDTLRIVQTAKTTLTNVTSNTKAVGSSKTTTSSARNKSASSSKHISTGQCAAITKKGTRCSRRASSGSCYCWQHNR